MKNLLMAVCCILSLALTAATDDKTDNIRVDSILASVNGTPISLLDVADESVNEEARLQMMYSGDELKAKVKALRRSILDDIISRKLIVEEYRNDPFEIPRQYIENMLDDMSSNFSDGSRKSLKHKLKESGITIDDLEEKAQERIIVEFMLGNLFYKGVDVTPRDVFEYYNRNSKDFSTPASIRLEVIYLSNGKPDMDKVLKEIGADLESGNAKIFNSLVALHSEAPNAKNGGDLGWIEKDKLRPEFATVKDAPVGSIKGPVQTAEGYYFIRVAEINEGGKIPFEQINRKVEEQLKREQRKEVYSKYIDDLRQKALIRYFFKD